MTLVFSSHALKRLFERSIAIADVRAVLETGELIASYPDDQPLPSALWFGRPSGLPLHVVAAQAESEEWVIITVYRPDPALWEANFTRRLP
jgi:hypothetical protein